MQKKLIAAALGLMVASPAMADDHSFSSNVTLTSDYLFRGVSQSGQKPALQGGFDYEHASGFYAGVWGSSISVLTDSGIASSANLEIDTYLGFSNSFAEDFSYDVGFLRYNYPGNYNPGVTKPDTNEIYGALGWKWLTAKYSYSLGDTFGVADARGSSYLELNASYEIPDTGITLDAHWGSQKFSGSNASALRAAGTDPDYTDYNVSISKDFSGYVVGLTYSNTNVTAGGFYNNPQGKNLARATTVVSLSRSF